MKQPYQIENRRAMQRFQASVANQQEAVQMLLPAVEIVRAMREGLGELMRWVGLELAAVLMQQEVEQLAGPKSSRPAQRQAYRWGQEEGWCRVDGQKVAVKRPRVRDVDSGEVQLGSYRLMQHDPQFEPKLWKNLMLGLSTRNYGRAVRKFAQAYGIEKSVVSEQFIEVSRKKLRELLERPLGDLALCAVMIDGIEYDDTTLVVALGIGKDGRKTILGLRQGATENATVVSELCADLEQRGLDFSEPRLYVLDGAKALSVAVKKRAGESVLLQRCQLHKRPRPLGGVLRHLPEEQQPFIEQKLIAAWKMSGYAEARRALANVGLELERINPSAARSLMEGLEETLTIHRLGVPELLRKTLFSTNPIESAFSVVDNQCRRVKKWQGGDMKLRWVASGLLFAEGKFHRVQGYKHLPQLIAAMQAAAHPPGRATVAVARKAG